MQFCRSHVTVTEDDTAFFYMNMTNNHELALLQHHFRLTLESPRRLKCFHANNNKPKRCRFVNVSFEICRTMSTEENDKRVTSSRNVIDSLQIFVENNHRIIKVTPRHVSKTYRYPEL